MEIHRQGEIRLEKKKQLKANYKCNCASPNEATRLLKACENTKRRHNKLNMAGFQTSLDYSDNTITQT